MCIISFPSCMSGVVFISVCLGFSLVPFAFLGGRVSHPQRVLIGPLQLSVGLSSSSRGKVVLDLETFLFPSTRGHPRRAVPGLGPAFPACFSVGCLSPSLVPESFSLFTVAHFTEPKSSQLQFSLEAPENPELSPESCFRLSFLHPQGAVHPRL